MVRNREEILFEILSLLSLSPFLPVHHARYRELLAELERDDKAHFIRERDYIYEIMAAETCQLAQLRGLIN